MRQVGAGQVKMFSRHEMLELDRDRRPRARHRHPRHGDRRDRDRTSRTRSCSRRAATATSFTSRPTPRAATSRRSGAPTRRARRSRTRATRRSTRRAFRSAATISRKLTLMSESLRNDGRIWVPKKTGRHPRAGRDPRRRARLLPRAQVPDLRQPRAARHRVARGEGGLRRGARCRARRSWRLPRFLRRHRAARGGEDRREVRQPLRDVRADHGRGRVQGPDAHLPGGRTTRWAACGWTTT